MGGDGVTDGRGPTNRGRVALLVPAYGMRTQLQPDRLKTHALLGSVQKPSHVGASACPQGVVRHSHEPLDAAAEHTPPALHCPWHWPSVKRHG